MLSSIKLSNFKCFQSLELNCAPLTLLCGLNGMGKSSVIQSLLILRQSFLSGDLIDGKLVLGGELVDLGTGVDVLFEGAESDSVEFELHSDKISTPWALAFDYSKTTDQLSAGSSDSDRSTLSLRIKLITELLKTQETLQQTQYIVTPHSSLLPDLLSNSSFFAVCRIDRNTRIDQFSTWGPLARSSDIDRMFSDEQEGYPYRSASSLESLNREIALFVEDYTHEQVVGVLIQRIAKEYHIAVRLHWRTATSGYGRVVREFKEYLHHLNQQGNDLPDLIIVATDANCQGLNE